MNVQDAVNWPRFHHQWMPDELRMEPGYLARHRRPARTARLYREARQRAGRVRRHRFENGWLEGAADPARKARPKDINSPMNHYFSTHLFVNHRLTSALLTKSSSSAFLPSRSSAPASTSTIRTRRRSPSSATGFAIPS